MLALTEPHPPADQSIEDELENEEDTNIQENELNDPIFAASTTFCELHLSTQGELKLNNFVRDLRLSKIQIPKFELLDYELKCCNFLQNDNKVIFSLPCLRVLRLLLCRK